MNKKELIDAIVSQKENETMSRKDAEQIVYTMLDIIKKTVRKGDDVSLTGFGTFSKAKRAARMGVNPSSGEKIKIKAKTVPKFRPGKSWKEMF